MIRPLWFLLIGWSGSLYGQNGDRNPIESFEKLKWKAAYNYTPNPYDTAFGFYNFYLRSLTYARGDVDIWTIDLLPRMQHYMAASIYDKTVFYNAGTPYEKKVPKGDIDVNDHKDFLKCPELISGHVIAISDKTGFLLLDKHKGTVLIDIPDKTGAEYFFIDSGRYTIKIRSSSCSNFVEHGAEFTSRCSGYLFHFNGYELFVFNKRNRLIERIAYNANLHRRKSGSHHVGALFNYKKWRVEITGIIYKR